MAWFEVFIPGKQAGTPAMTLTVEAPNWIGALRTGLSNIGEGQESISNVMCDIKEDNSIHVTDVASHRVFRLREVKEPSVAVAVAPALPVSASDDEHNPPTMLDGSNAADLLAATTTREPQAPSAQPPRSGDPGMGQSTIEMSVPWAAAMPSPNATLPSLSPLAPPKAAALTAPTAVTTPRATEAPPAQVTVPFRASPFDADKDAALRQPKIPTAPAPVNPVLSNTATVADLPAVALPAEMPASVPTAPTPPVVASTPTVVPAATRPTAFDATERLPRAPGPDDRKAEGGKNGKKDDGKKDKKAPMTAARGTAAPPPRRPSGQFENAPRPISREITRDEIPASVGRTPSLAGQVAITDALADVFDATQDLLLETKLDPKRIAEVLLDIALTHVPAESGTFYLADLNGHELTFAAVRGPKADAIKKGGFSVPVGQGIVGFCALEGVCLGVTDIQKDPRYFSAVADAIGYTPHDTLCASAESDGRLFGAVQLINSKHGFSAAHMEVLRYIGLTAAQLLERHFDAT